MKHYLRLSSIILIAFLLSVTTSLQAQQSFEVLSVEYGSNLSSENGNLGYSDFKANIAAPIFLKERFVMLTFPTYNRTKIKNIDPAISSDTFHRIDLLIIMQRPLSKGRSVGGIISPGLHSDFKDISGEDMVFTAAAFMSHGGDRRFQYRYGLLFSHQVNGNIIFPVFSFSWQATDRLLVDANNPLAPDISYRFNDQLTGGIQLERAGGSYKLTEDAGGRYLEDDRSDIAPYVELSLFNNVLLKAKAGYTTRRSVELYEEVPGSTWFEALRGTDPIIKNKTDGWFFEVGLGLEFSRD